MWSNMTTIWDDPRNELEQEVQVVSKNHKRFQDAVQAPK